MDAEFEALANEYGLQSTQPYDRSQFDNSLPWSTVAVGPTDTGQKPQQQSITASYSWLGSPTGGRVDDSRGGGRGTTFEDVSNAQNELEDDLLRDIDNLDRMETMDDRIMSSRHHHASGLQGEMYPYSNSPLQEILTRC